MSSSCAIFNAETVPTDHSLSDPVAESLALTSVETSLSNALVIQVQEPQGLSMVVSDTF